MGISFGTEKQTRFWGRTCAPKLCFSSKNICIQIEIISRRAFLSSSPSTMWSRTTTFPGRDPHDCRNVCAYFLHCQHTLSPHAARQLLMLSASSILHWIPSPSNWSVRGETPSWLFMSSTQVYHVECENKTPPRDWVFSPPSKKLDHFVITHLFFHLFKRDDNIRPMFAVFLYVRLSFCVSPSPALDTLQLLPYVCTAWMTSRRAQPSVDEGAHRC